MSNVIIVPMMGASPLSHMGHYYDLSDILKDFRGHKFIGLSSNADIFTEKERLDAIRLQWYPQDDIIFLSVSSVGETIARAYDSIPSFSSKNLTILVGSDRLKWGNDLKNSIERKKIKEFKGEFASIEVCTPDLDRSRHGLSGTRMRQAAFDNAYDTFREHLGPNFTKSQILHIFNRTRQAILAGRLKIKRH